LLIGWPARNRIFGSNPFRSATINKLAVPKAGKTAKNPADFARVFVPESLADLLDEIAEGLRSIPEKLILRRLLAETGLITTHDCRPSVPIQVPALPPTLSAAVVPLASSNFQ